MNISGSSVTDEVYIPLCTLHFLGNRLRCLCSRCESITGFWIICIMCKNFHYIRKYGALCTCFMDIIMIFISVPETSHFVVVIELHVVDVFIVLRGVRKWCVVVLLIFYYFDLIYLSWFVLNFWYYVMNFNFVESLYSTLAQDILYVVPVLWKRPIEIPTESSL